MASSRWASRIIWDEFGEQLFAALQKQKSAQHAANPTGRHEQPRRFFRVFEIVCLCQRPVKVTGAERHHVGVEIPEHPRRIVSLASGLTEALVHMGYGDSLAGVSIWCPNFTPGLNLPIVGDYLSVDEEKLRAVQPDLILITTGAQRGWNFRTIQADISPSHNIIHDGPSMMKAAQWLHALLGSSKPMNLKSTGYAEP